jgi:hypothetical protein
MKHTICLTVLISMVLNLFGCGTIMYPERRGQRAGDIDIKVAVLDGIGLIFFIIPGVIAYAVDFSTGAIYLPGGHRSGRPGLGARFIQVNPVELRNSETIRKIVIRETGIPENVAWNKLEAYPMDKAEEAMARLSALENSGYRPADRIAAIDLNEINPVTAALFR